MRHLPSVMLILALAVLSCTKSSSGSSGNRAGDTASIIGTWNWAYQSKTLWDPTGLSPLTPGTTGISRTITFDSTGRFTFMHNDSIFQDSTHIFPILLRVQEPIRLLAAPETDTGSYQVSWGIVGWCDFQDTTEVILQHTPYQAHLSADTLMVYLNPCQTRIADIYVRQP
ncbi:MAG TPA: hypothetical protein VN616_16250 [Puia sp.]|nr:hypothetical protein [Puia sp.]